MGKRVHEQNNFIFFTLALLLLLLTSALVDSVAVGRGMMLVEGLILVTQIVAFMSLHFGRRWRVFVAVTLLLIALANGAHRAAGWPGTALIALGFTLAFYVGVAYMVARRVLFAGHVNANIVVGALAIYLLLGLIWATLYLLVLELFPQAITGMEHLYWADNFSKALYFSYITMTSVGYGDITPAIAISRTLAYLQAITASFYMAVVVASLVGASGVWRK